MKNWKRRDFLIKTTVAGIGLPVLAQNGAYKMSEANNDPLEVHIFSKHLQFLDFKAAAEVAAEIGFSGIDLTVRPKGHIEPAEAEYKLPRAIEEISENGSSCTLITTAIESASNPLDKKLLQTASVQGIKLYRTNWFRYMDDISMIESLLYYQNQIKDLSILNKKLALVGAYQNHAGTSIGSSLWEVSTLLETADKNFFGVQYDIRHAMVEGALSWPNGIKLVKDQIKTIVLKDYKWVYKNSKWELVNTPIGEGMVDFISYFKLLKKYDIKVPAILHLEYPLGGAEHGTKQLEIDKKVVYAAMSKDLKRIRDLWAKA